MTKKYSVFVGIQMTPKQYEEYQQKRPYIHEEIQYIAPKKGVAYIGIALEVAQEQGVTHLFHTRHQPAYKEAKRKVEAYMAQVYGENVEIAIYRKYANGDYHKMHQRNCGYIYDTENFEQNKGVVAKCTLYEDLAGNQYVKYAVAKHTESEQMYALMQTYQEESTSLLMVAYTELVKMKQKGLVSVPAIESIIEQPATHYKQGKYMIYGLVERTTDHNLYVYYGDVYGRKYVRPFTMFTSNVEHEGQVKPRFTI